MGFNLAFKMVKIVKNPGNGRLNNLNHLSNLNDPVLNVLKSTHKRAVVLRQIIVCTDRQAHTLE